MAAVSVSSSSCSSTHLLHHLLRHPKPPQLLSLLFRPIFRSSSITHTTTGLNFKPPAEKIPKFTSPLSYQSLSSPFNSLFPAKATLHFVYSPEKSEVDEEEGEEEDGEFQVGNNIVDNLQMSDGNNGGRARKLPALTVKEKKDLASYAHSLGKNLKCQLVGKSGVTDTVVLSFDETLEKNELLKIKIHRTCPGELEDVVKNLEEETGSVVVGQIGRTVILYRPSVTKLKAEEKKKEAARAFVRKESKFKPASSPARNTQKIQKRVQTTRLYGRGRRGTSRV